MKIFNRKFVAVLSVLFVFTGTGLMSPDAEARRDRGHAKTSVNKNVNRNRNKNVNRNVNRNRNTNVNVNKNVNVNVDVDRRYGHPVARGVAIGTAAAVTAAVVGSIVYSLPPSCTRVVVGGVTYQQCGSTWYQPQYAGSNVQYIVVNAPN